MKFLENCGNCDYGNRMVDEITVNRNDTNVFATHIPIPTDIFDIQCICPKNGCDFSNKKFWCGYHKSEKKSCFDCKKYLGRVLVEDRSEYPVGNVVYLCSEKHDDGFLKNIESVLHSKDCWEKKEIE